MADHLPDLLDLLEFVEKKRRIKGSMSLAGMERVSDLIENPDAEVKVDLEFKREGRIAMVDGRVETDVVLQCQCCLELMDWPIRANLRLGVVGSLDEAAQLPGDVEPLLLESEGLVLLRDLVEDELVLAIPPIPQHDACSSPGSGAARKSEEHPFAALAEWKKNNR